jgi:hypothetical protein
MQIGLKKVRKQLRPGPGHLIIKEMLLSVAGKQIQSAKIKERLYALWNYGRCGL